MKKPALDLSDISPPNVSSIFEPSFSLSDTANICSTALSSQPQASTRRAEGAGLDGEMIEPSLVAAYADRI